MPCVILSMAGRPFMLTDAQFDQAQAVVVDQGTGNNHEFELLQGRINFHSPMLKMLFNEMG